MDWSGLGFGLTDEQESAAEAPVEGLSVVVAGAGCGKTYLVAARFFYLVKEKGVEPKEILCLTFSEYAAAEMRRRITHTLMKHGYIVPTVNAFTFHSFCEAMLRRYGSLIGLNRDFVVLDDGESELLMEEARRRLLDEPPYLKVLNVDMLWRALREAATLMNTARRDGLTKHQFAELRNRFGFGNAAEWRSDILNITIKFWDFYDEAKRRKNALDFDDLLEKASLLLKSEGRKVGGGYRFIIVDEYQDTDRRQQQILRYLCEDKFSNLFVVGDARQSIYAWRGAYPQGLLDLASFGRCYPLTRNFRSRNEILHLANILINADKALPESRLHNPSEPSSSLPPVTVCFFESPDEEARWVSLRIKELIKGGHSPDELAVLARSRTHLFRLEEELSAEGVRYVALVRNIYEAPEVLDVGHILVLGDDEDDEEARAWLALRRTDRLVLDGERRSPPEPDEEILSLAKETAFLSPFEAVELLAERLGYLREPLKCANIDRLLEQAVRWCSSFPEAKAADFGRYILAMRRIGAHEPVTDPYRPYGAVKILTIHAAKGLEFDTVFLFDTRVSRFRRRENFILDPDGVGIAIKRLPGDGKRDRDEYEAALRRRRSREYHESEERRLLHVAVTRARKHLIITGRRKMFSKMMMEALRECGFTR